VGKLISVSFVLSNNIWVVCSKLLSVEGINYAMEVKMSLVSHVFFKGALFFSGCVPIWCMLIKSVIKDLNKFIAECVNVTSFRIDVV